MTKTQSPLRRALDWIWARLPRQALASSRLTLARYRGAFLPAGSGAGRLGELPRFLRDRRRYAALPGGGGLKRSHDLPQLHDWTDETPFEPHYTYQDGWAARVLAQDRPVEHVDVGSRISFVVGLSAFVPVTFIDLRPARIELSGLSSRQGSILEMPYPDRSLESLSCLHVAEHIGLGRYGDPLDPRGTVKAAAELQRVLAPGGRLLFSLPVGWPRTEFNAHRVHEPGEIPRMFDELELESMAGIDDQRRFREGIEPRDLEGSMWACGLYVFRRRVA